MCGTPVAVFTAGPGYTQSFDLHAAGEAAAGAVDGGADGEDGGTIEGTELTAGAVVGDADVATAAVAVAVTAVDAVAAPAFAGFAVFDLLEHPAATRLNAVATTPTWIARIGATSRRTPCLAENYARDVGNCNRLQQR
jgi:hypothetical protein